VYSSLFDGKEVAISKSDLNSSSDWEISVVIIFNLRIYDISQPVLPGGRPAAGPEPKPTPGPAAAARPVFPTLAALTKQFPPTAKYTRRHRRRVK